MQPRILLWSALLVVRAAVHGGALALKLTDSHAQVPIMQPMMAVGAPAPAPAMGGPPIQDEDPSMSSGEEYVDSVLAEVDIGLSLEVPQASQAANAEAQQPHVPRNVVRNIRSVECLEKLLRDSTYNCSKDQLVHAAPAPAPRGPQPHGG
mmetsp:Transcript_40907/g.91753  ORF Transcript_40907/g.91753 Transcript_40907/m.91753 type:complete len:150 (-) Transcript_40907:86-535(-)